MSDFEDKLNSILSSPKDMEKIMGLARQLGVSADAGGDDSGSGQPSPDSGASKDLFSAFSDMDPKLFKAAGRILGQYSSAKNDKTDLVRSIKPYIRAERRKDLDRAVEIAKLARIAKIAFSEFSGGDSNL